MLALSLFSISYERMSRGGIRAQQRANPQPKVNVVDSDSAESGSAAEVALAAEEIKLTLGILGAAAQSVQIVTLEEGIKALDVAKNTSRNTIQAISEAQIGIFEKLQQNLHISFQLQ